MQTFYGLPTAHSNSSLHLHVTIVDLLEAAFHTRRAVLRSVRHAPQDTLRADSAFATCCHRAAAELSSDDEQHFRNKEARRLRADRDALRPIMLGGIALHAFCCVLGGCVAPPHLYLCYLRVPSPPSVPF